MKKLVLMLAVVFSLGMTSCSLCCEKAVSNDKAQEQDSIESANKASNVEQTEQPSITMEGAKNETSVVVSEEKISEETKEISK